MSNETAKPQLELVDEDTAIAPIAKPSAFSLDKFKSKRAAAIANVETLQTALPHHNISAAKDFVRLHPDEEKYWTPELCFVNVPIKGQKRDTSLASKPFDIFFLCHVPTQNTDNSWNITILPARKPADSTRRKR